MTTLLAPLPTAIKNAFDIIVTLDDSNFVMYGKYRCQIIYKKSGVEVMGDANLLVTSSVTFEQSLTAYVTAHLQELTDILGRETLLATFTVPA